jgi:hypothetical protein
MDEHHAPLPALDDEARAELLRLCRRKVVPAHHAIFRDGDQADHCYNITSGIVKLVKPLADGRQHIVGLLYASDFMGQSPKTRHTYAAESATDVDLCVYPKAPFEEFMMWPLELPFTRAEMADYLRNGEQKSRSSPCSPSRYIVIPDLELLSAVVNRNRTLTKAKAAPLPGQLQQHIRAMGESPT